MRTWTEVLFGEGWSRSVMQQQLISWFTHIRVKIGLQRLSVQHPQPLGDHFWSQSNCLAPAPKQSWAISDWLQPNDQQRLANNCRLIWKFRQLIILVSLGMGVENRFLERTSSQLVPSSSIPCNSYRSHSSVPFTPLLQLAISFRVPKEKNSCLDMEITFIIIIAQRDESTMTKCNLRPEQIKL